MSIGSFRYSPFYFEWGADINKIGTAVQEGRLLTLLLLLLSQR
jgi:hypothetical protein